MPLPASAMHILVALADGEKHGYAIMRDVEAISGGLGDHGLGHPLRVDQAHAGPRPARGGRAAPDPALDDQRRRYYRLTTLGQRVGAAEQQRLSRLLDAATTRRLGLSPGFATP